jgi:hypothetical protein
MHEQDTSETYQSDMYQTTTLARNLFSAGSAQTPGNASWEPDDGHYTMPFLRSHGTQEVE